MAVCLTRSHSVDSVVMFPWRLNSLKKVKGNKFKMLLFCEIYEPVFLKIKIKLVVHCAGITLVVAPPPAGLYWFCLVTWQIASFFTFSIFSWHPLHQCAYTFVQSCTICTSRDMSVYRSFSAF